MANESHSHSWITGEIIRREALKKWQHLPKLGESRLAYKLAIVKKRLIEAGYSNTSQGRGLALREVLSTYIEAIKPPYETQKLFDETWRRYIILNEQYAKGSATEVLIEKLGVSKSTYHREQKDACDLLAERVRQAETHYLNEEKKKRILSVTPPPLLFELVGRDELLKDLKRGLATHKIVSLVGLPGIGKTALATSVAYDRTLMEDYPDGVLWAGLGRTPDTESLIGTWATLLNIDVRKEMKNIEEWGKILRTAIGDRRFLLVIDDAWSLEEAFAFRIGGPNCAYLLTTRFPEIALYFSPKATILVSELRLEEGLVLLERVAPEAVSIDPEASQALVSAVGSLPLALILLGNYLREKSYRGYIRTLKSALERLKDAKERMQIQQVQIPADPHPALREKAWISLEVVIGLSVETLDPVTRHALQALAVFPPKPSSFSEEAALAISGQSTDVLDKLLIRYGLLETIDGNRYAIHQTITDYMRSTLEDNTPWHKFVAYYCEFAETHQRDYVILEREVNNLLTAMDVADERQMDSQLIQGANALTHYWQTRGVYRLAKFQIERAKNVAIRKGDSLGIAKSFLNLGRLATRASNYEEAGRLYLNALRVALEANLAEQICACQQSLGALAARQGKLGEAESWTEKALQTARKLEIPDRMCSLLANLGSVAADRGNLRRARTLYQEALLIARKLNDPRRLGLVLQNLGGVESHLGDHTQAENYYQEAWELACAAGDQERKCILLGNRGLEAYLRGDYEKAQDFCENGLQLASQLENQLLIGQQLTNLGMISAARENFDGAENKFQDALKLLEEIEAPWEKGLLYNFWGECYLQQEKHTLAKDLYKKALELAEKTGFREHLAWACFGLARVFRAEGSLEQGANLAGQSLEMYNTMEHWRAAIVSEWLARTT